MWGRICHAIGREDLINDPRYNSIPGRATHAEEIDALVAAWVKERTVAEVVQALERAEVPVGPVHTIAQAAHDPHLSERKMLVESQDLDGSKTFVPGLTVKFSDTPGAVGPIPRPGEHNEEVYCRLLGYSAVDLSVWQERGVI
jgi:crotonobetainyl-CoA:carnitine CoA-transferase CaiB-like acyl-CoA transferase